MLNGCVCCTVRDDLIKTLNKLSERTKKGLKLDAIVIETTGLADPGPVAQTFFMDDEIRDEFELDGIVTLIDAAHIDQQLGRSDESTEQVAFADVLVLNKSDLVEPAALDGLEARLRDMNRMARVVRTEMADVPIDTVLNLSAFDLDEVLQRRPSFLEPEYPFEWTGVYRLEPGRPYTLSLAEGPDPEMSLVIVEGMGTDDGSLREGAEWCVRRYADPAHDLQPGAMVPGGALVSLQLQSDGRKSFTLQVDSTMHVGLYAQHTAEEFDLQVIDPDGATVPCAAERTWVAQHEHDDEVGSFAIEHDGDVDAAKLNAWLGQLLAERGVDIFRLKGFVAVQDDPQRYVFQGVHMLLSGQPDQPWGDRPRRNQLVFIGRNLDEAAMRAGFEACLA